jgi:hypothetical protein
VGLIPASAEAAAVPPRAGEQPAWRNSTRFHALSSIVFDDLQATPPIFLARRLERARVHRAQREWEPRDSSTKGRTN